MESYRHGVVVVEDLPFSRPFSRPVEHPRHFLAASPDPPAQP